MARQSKTPLERLQAEIDKCNKRNGCNYYCSEQRQKSAPSCVSMTKEWTTA